MPQQSTANCEVRSASGCLGNTRSRTEGPSGGAPDKDLGSNTHSRARAKHSDSSAADERAAEAALLPTGAWDRAPGKTRPLPHRMECPPAPTAGGPKEGHLARHHPGMSSLPPMCPHEAQKGGSCPWTEMGSRQDPNLLEQDHPGARTSASKQPRSPPQAHSWQELQEVTGPVPSPGKRQPSW